MAGKEIKRADRDAIGALLLSVARGKRGTVTANLPMLLVDAIAAGCFLHGSDDSDQREAGLKLLTTAFAAMDRNGVATLVSKIKTLLPGNETAIARLTCAHHELLALFPATDLEGGDDE